MTLFKKIAVDFGKALTAGVVISFGATVFLSNPNRMFTSILFSLGLCVVCGFGLNLFTGKVGYLATARDWYNPLLVLISWVGNFCGMWLSALVLQTTRIRETIQEQAQTLVDIKSGDSLLSLFVLGIYCGILMYVAVALYRKGEERYPVNLMGYLGVFLCVAVFIHCGFEHSVADMFYYMVTNSMGIGRSWLVLLAVSAGNTVGAMIFRLMDYYLVEHPKLKKLNG